MNHYFRCIDNWPGASLEPRDSSLFKWSPWSHKCSCPKGTQFYKCIQQKPLKWH